MGFTDPLLAEALSCRKAQSWIETFNLNKVIVETDALMLVHAFSALAYNFSYFGLVLGDCQILVEDLVNFSLIHVR